MYRRMPSVCFPNIFSMVSECFQNGPNICHMLTSKGFLSKCREIYWSRGGRKAYGTQRLQIFIPNGPRTGRMFPERFSYMPYAPRLLPEYFPNRHGRHIRMIQKVDGNYFDHTKKIVVDTECRFVCIRTEPNSQYAPRTHIMLPEYDPFAPRTPKFLFGKQTEWYSAQCDRPKTFF